MCMLLEEKEQHLWKMPKTLPAQDETNELIRHPLPYPASQAQRKDTPAPKKKNGFPSLFRKKQKDATPLPTRWTSAVVRAADSGEQGRTELECQSSVNKTSRIGWLIGSPRFSYFVAISPRNRKSRFFASVVIGGKRRREKVHRMNRKNAFFQQLTSLLAGIGKLLLQPGKDGKTGKTFFSIRFYPSKTWLNRCGEAPFSLPTTLKDMRTGARSIAHPPERRAQPKAAP